MSLLEVKNLKTYFKVNGQQYPAVDDVSFSIDKGKIVAVIGESGSGKSVTALSIMGLIDYPGKIVDGEILYNGENLLKKKKKEMNSIRGNEISMIYQDPMSSLDPMMIVGKQIAESLLIHKKADKKTAEKISMDLMKSVGIADPEKRFYQYPNSFSGGMRQRLMIAMAIACNPKILIADEPTTALDVTIQAEILELLKSLKEKNEMSIILNTHDLGVVSEVADDVVVMYCGKIMEMAPKSEIFNNSKNVYTQELIKCIPKVNDKKKNLDMIPGYVPSISELPRGCRFSDRCPRATDKCKNELPELKLISENHWSRCFIV